MSTDELPIAGLGGVSGVSGEHSEVNSLKSLQWREGVYRLTERTSSTHDQYISKTKKRKRGQDRISTMSHLRGFLFEIKYIIIAHNIV